MNALEISSEMRTNLFVMKHLFGDKWEKSSSEYRAMISGAMTGSGDQSPISCAIPLAKEMSKRGSNPMMILAVATEMEMEKE